MTCCTQHLGSYLEGQGHAMTLQQKRVRQITLLFKMGFYNYLLFEVPFKNYFTEMITILRHLDASKIWVATLKVKVTA